MYTHRLVHAPAGRIHLVEQGSGPLVLLVHGIPESWYSWRHQPPALAAAGYRAVAVDVRGYGRSSRLQAVAGYRMPGLAEDAAAVVHALGERSAAIVGHDWGATIAANCALVRPEVRGGQVEPALLGRQTGHVADRLDRLFGRPWPRGFPRGRPRRVLAHGAPGSGASGRARPYGRVSGGQ
ncbi:alpha/beta fold hydrolase [Kitasatospora sp. NPDC093102]|uniref:alpha/beta fold hydrolase n=1 Tax=Kitasatospora sp. NPDC093102 TaxID=3155069 RepID=UPI003422164E